MYFITTISRIVKYFIKRQISYFDFHVKIIARIFMAKLTSIDSNSLDNRIILTIVPLMGSSFELEWNLEEEASALLFASNELNHKGIDCVHLDYIGTDKFLTIHNSI